MNRNRHLLGAALAATLLLACSDNNAPTPSIVGTWALLGFTDHGIAGATTGTATFRPDDSFEVIGTVTYPGEPTDALHVAGTYTTRGTTISLTTAEGSGDWDMLWTGSQFILTLQGPPPTNRIVLGPIP